MNARTLTRGLKLGSQGCSLAIILPESSKNRPKTGQKVSKKPPKNERPQFWAPGRGPSVALTPESDSTPKITIETTLRWALAQNWQILRPVLQNLGDRKRYCTSPLSVFNFWKQTYQSVNSDLRGLFSFPVRRSSSVAIFSRRLFNSLNIGYTFLWRKYRTKLALMPGKK